MMTEEEMVDELKDCAWWHKENGDAATARLILQAADLIEKMLSRIDTLYETNQMLIRGEKSVIKNERGLCGY